MVGFTPETGVIKLHLFYCVVFNNNCIKCVCDDYF